MEKINGSRGLAMLAEEQQVSWKEVVAWWQWSAAYDGQRSAWILGQAILFAAVDAHLTALTAVADVARREKEASEALDRLPGPAGFANADGEVDLDAYFEVYGHGGKYERLHAAGVEASEALHATVDALDGPGRVEAQYLIEG